MPPYFRFAILLILTGMIGFPLRSSSSPGERRLLATVEVISQKYCSAQDDELFALNLELRVNLQNHSDKVLILDKQFRSRKIKILRQAPEGSAETRRFVRPSVVRDLSDSSFNSGGLKIRGEFLRANLLG